MAEWAISLYHDTRRVKDGNLFPVKLRVYFDYATKYFATGFDLTKEDFQRSYLSQKPRQDYKQLKTDLQAAEARAKAIAKTIEPFDLQKFRKKVFVSSGSRIDVTYYYREKIDELKKEDRIKTAGSYEQSLSSLTAYLKSIGRDGKPFTFNAVTEDFLRDYERWMLGKGNSKASVGIYLRSLRHIFNLAIQAGEVHKDRFPFGQARYKIPQGQKVKKALPKNDIKKLIDYPLPENSYMFRARIYWIFSYLISGINLTDLARLKYKNILGNSIHFVRHKTRETTRERATPIIASIHPVAQEIIKRFGQEPLTPETYIFPILSDGMTETERVRAIDNTIRFINTHMKKLAALVGVDPAISSYWARHSFATISIRGGASLELIQGSLGHASKQTTQNYFAGFEDEALKRVSSNLLD